jgi:hypothetical protein
MNCANHPDIEKVAFCRTCGKPLCANCSRDVRGVIYCENCLAERLQGAQPAAAGFVPASATPVAGSGPNPALAGILAGFFPFGVGAVYTGQYAKGLAHLVTFTLLVWGQTVVNADGLHVLLGFGIAFFYVYQIIDAVRSAKAVQMGQPAPDPFGLAETFSTGQKMDTSKVPIGAVILIGLGVLFLLHNMGIWFFNMDRFWPIILIVIGGWLFARRSGVLGPRYGTCNCDRCRARCLMGPAVLITLGVLFLLQAQDIVYFHKTWPALLLVIGLVKLLSGNASTAGHISGSAPIQGMGPGAAVSGEVRPPSNEVNRG